MPPSVREDTTMPVWCGRDSVCQEEGPVGPCDVLANGEVAELHNVPWPRAPAVTVCELQT